MIKNIIFDLGGVLINYNPKEYILKMGYDDEKTEALLNAIFLDSLWLDMDKGIIEDYTEALEFFVKKHPELEFEIRSFFVEGWMEVYGLLKETEVFYNQLIDEGYKIYILSNYAKDGFAYIEKKYEFLSKADGKIVSSHVKCVKPDLKIYQILLDTYKLIPEESVFFDDKIENIVAANDLGIHGIQFTNLKEAKKQFELLTKELV